MPVRPSGFPHCWFKLDAELQSWLKGIADDFAPADEWRRRVRPHASKRLNREEE